MQGCSGSKVIYFVFLATGFEIISSSGPNFNCYTMRDFSSLHTYGTNERTIMIDMLSSSSAATAHQRAEDIITEAIAKLNLSKKEITPTSLSERAIAHQRVEKFKLLLDIFPDADQTYLRAQANKLDDAILLQEFVENALEKGDYPKRKIPKKYLGNQALKPRSTVDLESASTSSIGCNPPPSKKRRREEDSAEDMDDLFLNFVSTFLRNMPDGKNKRDLKKAIFDSLMNSDKEI